MAIASINPYTGETLRSYPPLSPEEIRTRIDRAQTAFLAHRQTSLDTRAICLNRVAEILEAESDRLARLATLEMGKTLQAAREEVKKCAWAFRHTAEQIQFLFGEEVVLTEAQSSRLRYDPLGVILAVMPWNFPYWQVLRFAAPALAAGNSALLKHASNVPQCALAIEDVISRAGFTKDVFQTLLIPASGVAQVIEDSRVRAASLTGSEAAGADLARRAGALLKKVVLELGGSDPFIVMPSADLDEAVLNAVQARLINNGQSCIAAKRFIVHEQIYPEFERKFVEGMKAIRLGDPLEIETELGPLATPQLRDDLDGQVRRSVKLGARPLTGGKSANRAGNFYEPTVLSEVRPGMPAFDEELFGPVASLFRVPNLEAAIELANVTEFGLGSSFWSRDETEIKQAIRDLEAGSVFVNAKMASDPRLPFGGVKRSGYGRELGVAGMREFVNLKTTWIA